MSWLILSIKIILTGILSHITGQYLLGMFGMNFTFVLIATLAYMFNNSLEFILKYVRIF